MVKIALGIIATAFFLWLAFKKFTGWIFFAVMIAVVTTVYTSTFAVQNQWDGQQVDAIVEEPTKCIVYGENGKLILDEEKDDVIRWIPEGDTISVNTVGFHIEVVLPENKVTEWHHGMGRVIAQQEEGDAE